MKDKERVIASARELSASIDSTLTELMQARRDHNDELERKAIGSMQLLMCSTMQELDSIIGFIENGRL